MNENSEIVAGGNEPLLIIGIGNPYRSDDGAGIAIARKLKTKNLSSITVREGSGEGASLMELWKDFAKVIIADATASSSPPGTVRRIDVRKQGIPSSFFHYSSHAFGVAEAIGLARVLGQLPAQCIVFGVEGEDFSNGIGLSKKVSEAVDKVVQAVFEECAEHEPT